MFANLNEPIGANTIDIQPIRNEMKTGGLARARFSSLAGLCWSRVPIGSLHALFKLFSIISHTELFWSRVLRFHQKNVLQKKYKQM